MQSHKIIILQGNITTNNKTSIQYILLYVGLKMINNTILKQ